MDVISRRGKVRSDASGGQTMERQFRCRSKCWPNLIPEELKLVLTAQFVSPADDEFVWLSSLSEGVKFMELSRQQTLRIE